jgi:hypothetical protein
MSEDRPVRTGDRIRHPDWGAGRVLALLRGGRVVRVEFDEMAGTPWEIPRDELMVLDPDGPLASSARKEAGEAFHEDDKAHPKEGPGVREGGEDDRVPVNDSGGRDPSPQDSVTARQAIEALRLGVVPTSHLDTYTVGRDVELVVVLKDLESAVRDGGFRVVLGDYGTGKTHFLEMAELLALESGFLATRATLDSREVVPNRPRRIFHQLARGIRYPDDPTIESRGLKPLLEKAAKDGKIVRQWSSRNSPDYHPYIGPALFYMAVVSEMDEGEELKERLIDWIEGSEVASNLDLEKELRQLTGARTRLYALKDFRTVTHLYTLILGGIAELARQVGYRGLAVMVDEAEFYSVLRGQDRTFADILFRTFAAASLPRSVLRFDPDDLPRGGQAIHQSFSFRYKETQPFYCVFALTHDPEGKAVLESSIPGNRFMELMPFTTEDYITLSSRVLSLYGLAQAEFEPGRELAKVMAKVIEPCHLSGLIENPRQALKFITEVVDITRHRPGRLRPMLADLKERLDPAP